MTEGMKLARLYTARKSLIKEKVRPWVALFLYLCIRKAALSNLKASFHCIRLHYLCWRNQQSGFSEPPLNH